MRTKTHQDKTREERHIVPQDKSPEKLWLDQDISGEQLVALDPLE